MDNSDSISDILDTLMILILYPSNETNNTQYLTDTIYNHDNHDNHDSHDNDANHSESQVASDTIFNELLNSTLHDKFTYKYILSEEGESQLKTINFTKELREINNICPIMSTEFNDNQNIISLPCSHYFEPDAINKWLREEKAECPVCRFKLHSKEVKIDEKNYIREDVYSLINLYRSRINLINSLSRVSYDYNPFSDNYFNMLMREREISEEYNDFIQNMTYTIFRQI
jgi:hypothetical protein